VKFLEVGTANAARTLALRSERVTIGRSEENDLILAQDMAVSRRHAVLEETDRGWRIRDLRSSNGTYVNGARVSTTASVNPGDRVTLGDSTLTLVDEADSEAVVASRTQLESSSPGQRMAFSKRESQVLRQVAMGMTDREIAEQLFISVKTVHSHLERIRSKSGLRRRADLTRLALELGLVNDPV
jgi:pSer/pThr/pTyr-binding forkhead associated (FHA) protein